MDWHEKYRDKIVSMERAASLIRSGDVITSNFGGSIPYAFLDALADYSLTHLENVTLYLAGFYKELFIASLFTYPFFYLTYGFFLRLRAFFNTSHLVAPSRFISASCCSFLSRYLLMA